MSNNLGQLTLYGIELQNAETVDNVSLSDVLTKAQVDTLIEEHMNDLVGTNTYVINNMNDLTNGLSLDDDNASEVIYNALSTEQQERIVEFTAYSNEIFEHNNNNLLMLNQFDQQIDTTFDQIKTTNSEISDKIFENFTEMSSELNSISVEFIAILKEEETADENLSEAYYNINNNYQQNKVNIQNRLVYDYQNDRDTFSETLTQVLSNEIERTDEFMNITFDTAQTNHETDFTTKQLDILSTVSTQNEEFEARFEFGNDVEVTLEEAINAESNLQNLLNDYVTTIDSRYTTTSEEYLTLDTSTNDEHTRNTTNYNTISDMIYQDIDSLDDTISTRTVEYQNEFDDLSEEIATLDTDLLDYEGYKASKDNPVLTGSLVVHDADCFRNWKLEN